MRSKLNLATKTYINRRSLYLVYAFGTAVLILVLITQFRYLVQMQNQERLLKQRIVEIQNQLGISAESAASYTETEFNILLEQIKFSNELILKDSFQWTGLLGQLESVLPADVRIVDIKPDFRDSTLTLSAQARSVKDLRLFIDRLNKSGDFTDVLLLSQKEQILKDKFKGAETLIQFNLQFKGALK